MRHALGPVDRATARLLRWLTQASTGYDIGRLADELLRTHGPIRVWEHLRACARINAELAERYGVFDSQLVLSVAGMLSGCRYCSIGHMYSANVALFRDHGRLGPVDEGRMLHVLKMTDLQIYESMMAMMAGDEYAQSRDLVERLWRLSLQREAPIRDRDDRVLRASLDVWSWAHECSIILGVESVPGGVPALGLMRPPRDLLKRYQEAREAQRQAPRDPESTES